MGKLTFRQEKCKGCSLCIEVCPVKIIEFDSKLNVKGYHPTMVKDEKLEKCIACASCARICPDLVISVER
jgi:2-oxoglutarate ferredoxin oxidoreductase subunit delta